MTSDKIKKLSQGMVEQDYIQLGDLKFFDRSRDTGVQEALIYDRAGMSEEESNEARMKAIESLPDYAELGGLAQDSDAVRDITHGVS